MVAQSKAKSVQYVTWLGMYANMILAVLKFCAGFFSNSQVLIADAVHSLSDLSTDVAILIGVRFWEQPADEDHPHGHGKIETVVTVFIGFILLFVGLGLARSAIETLNRLIAGETFPVPGSFALVAALLSIAVKEILYQMTARVGSRLGSSALLANAWHHRSDAISSVPASLAVAGCMVFGQKYVFLDPVGTILVSCMIIFVSLKILRPAFLALLDAGVSQEKVKAIQESVLTNKQICGVHKIRTRQLGCGNIAVDLHIQVDPHMDVRAAHQLCHQVGQDLRQQDEKIVEVGVHVEPCASCDQ